mmetsp:Transcript_21632/g.64764  ORF Transcript_21632/g.64764 Transcript_21632/m.64764 type:complete len:234 (+) Transcript_21632:894-1595(+)
MGAVPRARGPMQPGQLRGPQAGAHARRQGRRPRRVHGHRLAHGLHSQLAPLRQRQRPQGQHAPRRPHAPRRSLVPDMPQGDTPHVLRHVRAIRLAHRPVRRHWRLHARSAVAAHIPPLPLRVPPLPQPEIQRRATIRPRRPPPPRGQEPLRPPRGGRRLVPPAHGVPRRQPGLHDRPRRQARLPSLQGQGHRHRAGARGRPSRRRHRRALALGPRAACIALPHHGGRLRLPGH